MPTWILRSTRGKHTLLPSILLGSIDGKWMFPRITIYGNVYSWSHYYSSFLSDSPVPSRESWKLCQSKYTVFSNPSLTDVERPRKNNFKDKLCGSVSKKSVSFLQGKWQMLWVELHALILFLSFIFESEIRYGSSFCLCFILLLNTLQRKRRDLSLYHKPLCYSGV